MLTPADGLIEILSHHPGDLDHRREQVGVIAPDLMVLAAVIYRLDYGEALSQRGGAMDEHVDGDAAGLAVKAGR